MSVNAKSQMTRALNVKVQFNPSNAELARISGLHTTIDTLITHNGFRDDNIMKPKSEKTLFWDWTIVTVGNHKIPAPIHTISKTRSVLYNWNDQPVELSNKECACVTALFYVEMICMIVNDWDNMCKIMPPMFQIYMAGGRAWVNSLTQADYQDIMYALKMQLSEVGHYVLN